MLTIIGRTILSLRHKAILWLILASIITTLLTIISLVWLIDHLLNTYRLINIDIIEWFIDKFGIITAGILGWFIFPALLPAIAGLFDEKTAHIIEQNEYKKITTIESYPWYKEISFAVFGIFLNIIFLPIYIISPINIIVYYLLNSYLVGKGFFMPIATRQYGNLAAKDLAKKHSFKIKFLGAICVMMSNLPVLNLIAPIFGIVMMVHFVNQAKVANLVGYKKS